MTTWYTGPEDSLAYTTRPDIWPPGTCAWEAYDEDLEMWPPGWLAYSGQAGQMGNPAPGGGDPGVAEALILAGRVDVDTEDVDAWPWIEVYP